MTQLQSIARIVLPFLALGAQAARAGDNRWIVQVNPTLANSVIKQTLGTSWSLVSQAAGVYRVSVPAGAAGDSALKALKSNALVKMEPDAAVSLPEAGLPLGSPAHGVPALTGFIAGQPVWQPWGPYLNQPANTIVELQKAQAQFGLGGGLVAVIDTGVDFLHPVLFPVVNFWQGADFTGTGDMTGNSDLNQETSPVVDQETSPVVDASGTIVLNQETSPVVDQETSPVVDSTLPPDFGHGTMVAGIVHLVAPRARILPVKAFASDGTGSLSAVIASIYYAVAQGATVINMSFGAPQDSPLLQAAIQYAISNRVVCVAAVANGHSSALQYPSADTGVIGVGSTDNQDYRSSFSNWGADVNVFAPGEAIVTTFPFNRYALGWGTSFAAPYVSGTAALLLSNQWNTNVGSDLAKGAQPVNGLIRSQSTAAGRLDVYQSGLAIH